MRYALLFAVLATTGCGGAEVKQVTGSVLMDERPMPGVFVFFYPIHDLTLGVMSQSFTAPDGSYDIAPAPERGQGKAGDYCVIIGDIELKGWYMAAALAGTDRIPPPPGKRVPPARYWRKETTPIHVTIEPGVNNLEPFHLEPSSQATTEGSRPQS